MADTRPLLIVALLIVDSLHFVFARMLISFVPPAVGALYVLAIGTALVGLFGLVRRRIHLSALARQPWLFLSIGFCVATSTALNYAAVAFIDPGTASLLGQMSLVFGLGIGLVWLRERMTPAQAGGALLALGGVAIITFQPGDYLSQGALMVLASALLYAIHAAIAKRYGAQVDFVDFFFFRLLCTTAFLLLFVVGSQSLVWPAPPALALLALAGTVDVVVSRTLYYVLLRRMPVSLLSIVLTLSPAVAIGWSLLLFAAWPTPRQLLGGAAVLLGVAVATLARSARDPSA
jgi:O-acetylserine/cysteine efflux transporter